MTFDEYQERAYATAIYPKTEKMPLAYPTLGLAGEAGEVAEKVKKIARDCDGTISWQKRDELVKELGDVLWYLSAIATDLGVNLSEIAQTNLQKLEDRSNRDKLHGQGDNR